MSSSDVGSYEFQQSPCEMQMEECSAHLARSTSDGSADDHYYYGYYCYSYYVSVVHVNVFGMCL